MIGLLGGTFDPVHFGHINPALEVCKALRLERILFIPAANPPHRPPPVASIEHRINMLQLVMPMYECFELDDREQRMGGVSYTVRTLDSLRSELGDTSLGLIMGADAFAGFESWHRWQDILELAHLLVMNRPGSKLAALPAWARDRVVADSGELESRAGGLIHFIQVTPKEISATDIRDALAANRPVTGMLPAAVLNYIETNRLYML